jgi:maltose alpha-D-glucosyltransferase/alpha-amylase
MDPLYGYQSVNVEAQTRDPHSLLNWMRRILAVRRQHRAFGRGSLRFLYPKNRRVLAYLREYEGETILCVANVARSPQAVELDLSEMAGRVPVELSNGSLFPPIGQLTYLLTLPPYGFYWFILVKEGDWPPWHTQAPEPLPEYQTVVLRRRDLADALLTSERGLFEREVLPPYLAKRRWFALKHEKLEEVRLAYVAHLPGSGREVYLGEVEARTKSGVTNWQLPLSIVWEGEPTAALPSQLALERVRRDRQVGLLTDAFAVPAYARQMLAALAAGVRLELPAGEIRFQPTPDRRAALQMATEAEVNWLSAEQSNSSLVIGDAVMLKIFRRVSAGQHPEAEMSRYLAGQGFSNAPPLLGEIVRIDTEGKRHSLAVAQGFVRNQGDAWAWLIDRLDGALDAVASPAAAPDAAADHIADCESMAAAIGQRLGEMHEVLARPTDDPDFAPMRATSEDALRWCARGTSQLTAALDAVAAHQWDRSDDRTRAAWLQERGSELVSALGVLAQAGEGTVMCRIHGDFHLGQVLVASGDAYIIDFEGEPARPLAERRAKMSPLRDVAGLLRSFDYLTATITDRSHIGSALTPDDRRNDLIAQFHLGAPRAFMQAYTKARGEAEDVCNERLLYLFLLEKAAYELLYEAANRPTWLSVPLGGLAALAHRILDRATGEARDER